MAIAGAASHAGAGDSAHSFVSRTHQATSHHIVALDHETVSPVSHVESTSPFVSPSVAAITQVNG